MSKRIKAHKFQFGLGLLAAGILLMLVAATFSSTTSVSAAPLPQDKTPSNETCLFCHDNVALTTEIGGQTLILTISGERFETSVHNEENITCADCHSNIRSFPHPDVTASSPRDFSLEMYPSCRECHGEQYEKVLDSVHQTALAGGNTNAAVCTDCHNPHTQTRLTDKATGDLLEAARVHIPETCAKCHSKIYNTYRNSIHGSALTEGNPDVPTCIDCHGVHNIQNPTTNSFRNSTPFLCAKCHTDETIMDQYDISTKVLDTYVADFHGATVKLFEETYPDQPSNKPVCTDCHGIHDIVPVKDPNAGIALKMNLLVKCQQCHPDATTETFTEAWMSHYEPSPDTWPLVYYVNLFYKFFIPAVLGGMILFVLTDIYRRIVARGKGTSHK